MTDFKKINFLIVLVLFCFPACHETQKARANLSNPEGTLAYYIQGLSKGDLKAVLVAYDTNKFQLSKTIPIDSYHIRKKTILTDSHIKEYKLFFEPVPRVGDVELQVEVNSASVKGMYTYYLRNKNGRWRIYAHYSWADDS